MNDHKQKYPMIFVFYGLQSIDDGAQILWELFSFVMRTALDLFRLAIPFRDFANSTWHLLEQIFS